MKVYVDFIAEKNPDFVSRCIMKFTNRPYSHVLIRFTGKNGTEQVFHAVGKGVCVEEFYEYKNGHEIVSTFGIELNCSHQTFYGFIEGASGKDYSELQLLAIAMGLSWLTNGSEKMICSELVGDLLVRYSDIKLTGNQDLWTPGYIHDELSKQLGG